MIRGIVLGVLLKEPERKTAASGTGYCKAMLRVDCKQLREGDPQHLVAFVTAFAGEADLLAAKRKGDSVAVAGRLDIRAGMYQDAPQASVSVTVDRVIDATRPPRNKGPRSGASEQDANLHLGQKPSTATVLRAYSADGGIGDMPEDAPW